MKLKIDNEEYDVVIIKKRIKNMYLRVKENMQIQVTCNNFTTNKEITSFIEKNSKSIVKMIKVQKNRKEKSEKCYILNKPYDIVICNLFKKIKIDGDKIYVDSKKTLDKFILSFAKQTYESELNKCYKLFKEKFDYPVLTVKNMKSRWGYCVKRDKMICIALKLIEYSLSEVDYVIIHELSHFVHFDHSKEFWQLVSKYKPDYKNNRKVLKES